MIQSSGSIDNSYFLLLVLLLIFFVLHETSSVKNQYNDIKDKIEKKNMDCSSRGSGFSALFMAFSARQVRF